MCQHPSHLHMTCGWCADDVRTMYVIRHLKSPTKSHSRVIRTSSARRPHIVRTSSAGRTHETSVPRLFQVKHQRTALLKIRMSTIRWKLSYFRDDTIKISQLEESKWIYQWSIWILELKEFPDSSGLSVRFVDWQKIRIFHKTQLSLIDTLICTRIVLNVQFNWKF